MADEDVEVIRKGYAAFVAGDLAALAAQYAEDATWTVPGNSPYAGTKHGRDAIIAFLVEVATISGGTYKTTNLALAGVDGRVFALDSSQATRNGKTLNMTGVNVFELKDGLVQSVQQYFEDTTESDAFWA